jgi:hypothetical protein
VGTLHLSRDITVIDVRSVTLKDLRPRLGDVKTRTARGDMVIVAVGPVGVNPTAVAFAETADAAILCVTIGASHLADADRAIEEIGRERFLGTAVLANKRRA